MKVLIKNLCLILVCMGFMAMPVAAQTLTTLHSFSTFSNSFPQTNSDGANPYVGLILSSNTLYGTANKGGSSGFGTVFAVNTDGTSFTTLHSFANGNDGDDPYGLILSGSTLYGTADEGGSLGFGTIFAINTNGSNFTTLHSFTNGNDGAYPFVGLILSGSTLYGTTDEGGTYGNGMIFAINTNGLGFTNLYSFTGGSDGDQPMSGLILSGNTLYGDVCKRGCF
jgi:uncharacterized repeat protein (TIGR03803 family)